MLFRRTYTHASKEPRTDVLIAVDAHPEHKTYLARITIGDVTGWVWVNGRDELGTRENNDRPTPLTWSFATSPDRGKPVRLRTLTAAQRRAWHRSTVRSS